MTSGKIKPSSDIISHYVLDINWILQSFRDKEVTEVKQQFMMRTPSNEQVLISWYHNRRFYG